MVCQNQIQECSRPISAGKAEPKGGEKRAIDPKGHGCDSLVVCKKAKSKTLSVDIGREG